MTRAFVAVLAGLVLASPVAARASCQDDIAAATARAEALPASDGRAALQEQIQRADVARHEGDPEECADSLSVATDVLDRIDVAKAAKPVAP